jgi:hypothetical protein
MGYIMFENTIFKLDISSFVMYVMGLIIAFCYCSVSRWRPQKVDKRMVLEHTHGLFIT